MTIALAGLGVTGAGIALMAHARRRGYLAFGADRRH